VASDDLSQISRDPDVCGRLPVSAGTAVPVYVLIEYLAEGGTLHKLLSNYPSVPPERAVAALRYLPKAAFPSSPRD
jgi:uncharacterized protein (DUF433 family)